MTTTKLDNTARAHLEAGHQVAAWWKVDQQGFLELDPDPDYPHLDIVDTKLGDAEPTEEVRCQTCDQVLELTPDVP